MTGSLVTALTMKITRPLGPCLRMFCEQAVPRVGTQWVVNEEISSHFDNHAAGPNADPPFIYYRLPALTRDASPSALKKLFKGEQENANNREGIGG